VLLSMSTTLTSVVVVCLSLASELDKTTNIIQHDSQTDIHFYIKKILLNSYVSNDIT